MVRRAQRWLSWVVVAWVAFQIYVVREWLAVVFLAALACAGVAALVAIGLLLRAAWQASRSGAASVWGILAESKYFQEKFLPREIQEPGK